jgi:hypothetical protein
MRKLMRFIGRSRKPEKVGGSAFPLRGLQILRLFRVENFENPPS